MFAVLCFWSYADSSLLGCTVDAHKTEPIIHHTPSPRRLQNTHNRLKKKYYNNSLTHWVPVSVHNISKRQEMFDYGDEAPS